MFISTKKNLHQIYSEIKNLGDWGHYYNFNNKLITGYWESLYKETGRTVFFYKEPEFKVAKNYYEKEFQYQTGGKQFNKLFFIKDLISNSKSSVLDLGCNDGMKSFFLERLGLKNITALDIREDCIVRARYIKKILGSKINFDLLKNSADSKKMKFNQKYDYVLSFGILHHLIDHKQHIINLNKISKKGFMLTTATDKEGVKLLLKRNFFTYKLREDSSNSFKAINGKYIIPTKKEVLNYLNKINSKYLSELVFLDNYYHSDFTKHFSYLFLKK